jgi:hypothetical protein
MDMDYVEEVALEVAEFTSLEEHASAADADKKPAASADAPEDDATMCVVCLVERKDHVFIPCGHLCACEGCATEITNMKDPTCPMCRAPFVSVNKVFL